MILLWCITCCIVGNCLSVCGLIDFNRDTIHLRESVSSPAWDLQRQRHIQTPSSQDPLKCQQKKWNKGTLKEKVTLGNSCFPSQSVAIFKNVTTFSRIGPLHGGGHQILPDLMTRHVTAEASLGPRWSDGSLEAVTFKGQLIHRGGSFFQSETRWPLNCVFTAALERTKQLPWQAEDLQKILIMHEK